MYPPTAICGAFRMHGAHILPKPAHFGYTAAICCHELAIFPSETAFGMHGAQNLPRIAARERTAAESCHGKTPGNAPREYIATASQAKSASGRNPATVGRRGNAFRGHFAIVERLGTYQGIILPRPDAHAERPARPCAMAPARPTPRGSERPPLSTPPDIPTPLNCGCCRRFGRWRWHNPLIVALLPSGS